MKRENVWRKKLEEDIAQEIADSLVLKMHVGVMDSAGKPDIYVTAKRLGDVWLELKYVDDDGSKFDWGKEPSKIQKDCLRKLYYAGARVGVIVFFEEVWRAVHDAHLIEAMRLEHKWGAEDPQWNWAYTLEGLVFGTYGSR